MRALYDGILRSCHTWALANVETGLHIDMVLNVGSGRFALNSIGAMGTWFNTREILFLRHVADPIALKSLSKVPALETSLSRKSPHRVNALVYE